MQNQNHAFRSGVIAAVIAIIASPIIGLFTLAFIAVLALGSGDARSAGQAPFLMLFGLLFAALAILILACVPLFFFWKTDKRWRNILVYLAILIFAVPGAVGLRLFWANNAINFSAKNGDQVQSFARSLYGKWQTQYKGESLIIEFVKGPEDEQTYYEVRGTVKYYRPGALEAFDQGTFWLVGYRGLKLEFGNQELNGQPFIRVTGEPKLLSENQIRYKFTDIKIGETVLDQEMLLSRVE